MNRFKGLAGLLAGTGLIATGATVVVGCGDDFSGCAASRTCPTGGTAGTSGAGVGDDAGSGGGSGIGGSGAASASKGGSTGTGGGSQGSTDARSGSGGSTSTDAGEGGSDVAQDSSGGMDVGAHHARGGGGGSGSGSGGAAGEAGVGSSAGDDTPPTVLATTPADGATGVVENATISITFSEPMNTDTVMQAYASDDLPANSVTLSWADHNTRLVITPSELLEYAAVTSVDGPARTYTVTIGSTAVDVAGNPLGVDWKFTFDTLRRMSLQIPLSNGFRLTHPHDGSDDYVGGTCLKPGTLYVGDIDTDKAWASILTFDAVELPAGVVDWESAFLRGPFTTPTEDPFGDGNLGSLRGYSVRGLPKQLTWNSPATYIGVAATANSEQQFSLDVLDALADYSASPDEYGFEVLLRFERDTNADGIEQYITGTCDETSLDVVCLVP